MVYNSLTDVPSNLREGIDWLMALKGTDAEKNLGAMGDAIYRLFDGDTVGSKVVATLKKIKRTSKKFLKGQGFKDQWFVKELLQRLDRPLNKRPVVLAETLAFVEESDYENVVEARGVRPENIAKCLGKVVDSCEKFVDGIKTSGRYGSSYSSKATWDASCAKDPEACAVVLVGIAPMLYAGLSSLQIASEIAVRKGSNSVAEKRLGDILKAVGYDKLKLNSSVSISDILKAMEAVDVHILTTLYDLAGFWALYDTNVVGNLEVEQSTGVAQSGGPEGTVEPEGLGERERPEKREKGFEDEGVEIEGGEEPKDSAGPEGVAKSVAAEGVDAAEGKGGEAAEQPAGVEEPVIAEEPVKAVKAAKTVKAAKKAAKKLAKKARQKKNPIPDPQ
ncbi:hypothetical protein, conserved [Babesia ovata]|uniref:Uncharacterized protein n=1 Tax=Babesia ovata TaxID=189622 RepID=A0A2H6KI48_9APIC|nr:uncharacterized protein BOVATA_041650 [Babesia ovata]GBE62672.1 hypothetical protein, conserved [Babesia ovata]